MKKLSFTPIILILLIAGCANLDSLAKVTNAFERNLPPPRQHFYSFPTSPTSNPNHYQERWAAEQLMNNFRSRMKQIEKDRIIVEARKIDTALK